MTYAEKLKEYPEKEDYRKKGVNLYPPVSVEVTFFFNFKFSKISL